MEKFLQKGYLCEIFFVTVRGISFPIVLKYSVFSLQEMIELEARRELTRQNVARMYCL